VRGAQEVGWECATLQDREDRRAQLRRERAQQRRLAAAWRAAR